MTRSSRAAVGIHARQLVYFVFFFELRFAGLKLPQKGDINLKQEGGAFFNSF